MLFPQASQESASTSKSLRSNQALMKMLIAKEGPKLEDTQSRAVTIRPTLILRQVWKVESKLDQCRIILKKSLLVSVVDQK